MALVIVERSFSEPVSFEFVEQMEQRAGWCLEMHGVVPLHSYLSADGCRMICMYEAPDAESVRLSQEKAKLPFDRVWTGERYGGAGD